MAAGFAVMWIVCFTMDKVVEDDTPIQEILFNVHVSIGVTLLALLALRIVVRLTSKPPPLPDAIKGLEHTAARAGHYALYALPLIVIALGWAQIDMGGHVVDWFGVDLPVLFTTDEDLADWAAEQHMWGAYLFLAASVGHVLAAIRHQRQGHDIMGRMTLRW